jgi:enoyl-CoA hydratase/carnithine racemase
MSQIEQTDVGRVLVESDREVTTILLDRPAKHNALTPEMLGQLEEILIDLDREVRVVIIT